MFGYISEKDVNRSIQNLSATEWWSVDPQRLKEPVTILLKASKLQKFTALHKDISDSLEQLVQPLKKKETIDIANLRNDLTEIEKSGVVNVFYSQDDLGKVFEVNLFSHHYRLVQEIMLLKKTLNIGDSKNTQELLDRAKQYIT